MASDINNQELATKQKELGNVAYKKKDLQLAFEYYNKAIELDGKNMVYYTNASAVLFEQKEYEQCIEWCMKAVDVGRENKADFKLIAKAYARAANASRMLGEHKKAKNYYEKSLAEHRTPDVKAMLSEVEVLIKEEEKKAYLNPELAEKEKEKGNELFKKGQFSDAIGHYSEAIKRNPDDAKLYGNRAACYMKLAAFDLGLKDCEKCLELDPKFTKVWIRKGKILQGMKQHSKAAAAYQRAIDLEPNATEAIEGRRQCTKDINPAEALNNKEIQEILADPAMRMILEQMQNDPKAAMDHLKNPDVAAKITKLINSGILSVK